MKLAIFADETRKKQLRQLIKEESIAKKIKDFVFYQNYDDFILHVPNSRCSLVIIAHQGAMGMQGARAAKILLQQIPIIWFSDDNGFVEESYRIGCTYFSAEIITEEVLHLILDRCTKIKT